MATIDVMLNLATVAPADVGTTAVGVGTAAARDDHVHAHGNQAGGSLHALVIAAGAAGFMTGADKTKLDGLPTSAVPTTRVLTAGGGLTGGGDLTADRTFDAVANADGSIVVNPNDLQVGILATDAQHGNLGGGSLHALAIAAGAAGFMSGADKTKLDGIAAGASSTFVGLTDTAGAIAVNQFARGNGAGTSVDFFDLFGTANTWTAAQTINAQLNMGGNVIPTTNQTRDVGSSALRFRQVHGTVGSFIAPGGISTVQLPANAAHGGIIGGTQTGGGTNTHRLEGGAFPAVACFGVASSRAGSFATLEATRGGAIVLAAAYGYGVGNLALVSASGYSAICIGYAYGAGVSTLRSSGSGSLAFGYANARIAGGTVTIQATANGAMVAGFGRQQPGSATLTLQATGDGSFAQGYMRGGSTGVGRLEATGRGAFAQGGIRADTTNNARISAYGNGSFAQGYALAPVAGAPATIEATANGAFAVGFAQSTTIRAGAINAVQFGPGTNNTTNSLQVGTGFRANADGRHGGANAVLTLALAVTTFAAASNVMTITGDAGTNTIATITGGEDGQLLILIFVDALVTVTDDNTNAADTVDLSAAFVSANDTTLTLIYDGLSWYELSRSAN